MLFKPVADYAHRYVYFHFKHTTWYTSYNPAVHYLINAISTFCGVYTKVFLIVQFDKLLNLSGILGPMFNINTPLFMGGDLGKLSNAYAFPPMLLPPKDEPKVA